MTDRITNLATYLNEPYTWSVDSLNKAACESCSEKKQAKEETSCCPECHFEFEKEEAVPFLSDKIKKKLLKEHKELEEKGFPEKEMLAHSKREVKWFEEAGVPCEILTRIKEDHAILLGNKDSSSRPNDITSKVKHSLIKLSNYLDSMGHIKAADEIDLLIIEGCDNV